MPHQRFQRFDLHRIHMYSITTDDVMKSYLTRVKQENSYWQYYIGNKGCYVIKTYPWSWRISAKRNSNDQASIDLVGVAKIW